MITHDGQTLSIRGWARVTGTSEATIRSRLKAGWSVAAAIGMHDLTAYGYLPTKDESAAPMLVTGRRGNEWQTDDRIGSAALVTELAPGAWQGLCDCGGILTVRVADPAPEHDPAVCRRRALRQAPRSSASVPTRASRRSALARCYQKTNLAYHKYGGRGVRVCVRWRLSTAAFEEDMGLRPPGRTLDRLNNALGYGPGNCRWATNAEQARNTSRNRMIEFGGERLCVVDWEHKLGLKKGVLTFRLNAGWTVEQALTKPVGDRPRIIEFNGRRQTVPAWARELGINTSTLNGRLKAGWPVGKALAQKAASRR